MALIFKCYMCGLSVAPDDEVMIGEAVIHRECEDEFDRVHGDSIAGVMPSSAEAAATGGGYDPFNP